MRNRIAAWIRYTFSSSSWVRTYDVDTARADMVAGLTVGVMLIPQGMAYAVIAGLPPIYGLYAALVPTLAYPILASSRQLAMGPTAIDMLIVAAGVAPVAAMGSDEYVVLAILLAAMVGLIQIGMGAAKLGFVANLLSRPVITGLTTAAALIIGFSQLGNLLGIDLANSQYIHRLLIDAAQNLSEVHVLSLAIGVGCIAVLVALPRIQPLIPEALVVVVVATALSYGFGFDVEGVEVVGSIPTGLPHLDIPSLSPSDWRSLFPAALTLALVQFMKNISLGRVFARRHRYTIDANQELLAMGTANLLGSFAQGIPASGSFSRSAVNDQAGARTPAANIFAAIIIALTLLLLTGLFYFLPVPALAAIIMVAGFGLIDLREVRELFEARRRDGYIALFTAICTLVIGIQEGILLGIGASVVMVLYRISRPNVAELGHVPGTRLFRDIERFDNAQRIKDIMVLRVDAAFSFANAEYFKDFILEKSEREGRRIRAVVVDGTSINDLDTTAIEALEVTIETLEDQGIELHLTGLIGPVREVVRRSGLHSVIGEEHFHMEPHEAVIDILRRWDKDDYDDDDERIARYLETLDEERKTSTPAAS
ncbi:SulP family inorganic anion transporter [Longibacter sp.]|jgi:SulP family sulfate permease|uniref:SulP family inorganic anion transporter n=1 Tax=Longibacter sp. TaxID=2045415 RepID=UPI003EB8568C